MRADGGPKYDQMLNSAHFCVYEETSNTTLILFKFRKDPDIDIQTHNGFHHHLNLSGLTVTFPVFIHSLPDELYLTAGELRKVQEELNMLALRVLMLKKQEVLSSVKWVICITLKTETCASCRARAGRQ